MCVCDGAGSASRSEVGAKAVAKGIAVFLYQNSEELLQGQIPASKVVGHAKEIIHLLAKALGGNPQDYACTLLGVLLSGHQAVSVHVGDGVIAMVEEGRPTIVSTPDNGEFANTTTFVTSSKAVERARFGAIKIGPLVTSFILMTDGPEAVLYDKREAKVSQVTEQIASWLDQQSEEEVSSAMKQVIQNHILPSTEDDCTLAVIRRSRPTTRFTCPACRRWDLARGPGGRRRFQVACEVCQQVVLAERSSSGRTYPQLAREWVFHLVLDRAFSLRRTSGVTRIPRRTVGRWIHG